MLESNETC